MYITSNEAVAGTDRDARGDGWISLRLVLARDGLTVSVHETTVEKGASLEVQYNNHNETVYCIAGRATLTDRSTGQQHDVRPGSLYCAMKGDAHSLTIEERCTFLCLFDPPLEGQESAS